MITRDAATHRATIRAVRITRPLQVDGRLDEVYTRVEPISDFVQMEPHAGEMSTEKTDLWILFDDEYVYVTFRCWESHPERMIVNEMRRDNYRLWLGENVAFMFDTFHDRRNGVEFGITPAGCRYEGQFTNERLYNGDWNPVWKVAVTRFENSWIAESATPFTSLRFRPGRDPIWGFQARRIRPMPGVPFGEQARLLSTSWCAFIKWAWVTQTRGPLTVRVATGGGRSHRLALPAVQPPGQHGNSRR